MRDDKPYYELRKEMSGCRVAQKDLAEAIGRGESYISDRMTLKNKEGFSVREAYQILDFLELPYDKFSFYFPNYSDRKRKCR